MDDNACANGYCDKGSMGMGAGICRKPLDMAQKRVNGEFATADGQCESGYHHNWGCFEKLDQNDPCGEDGECSSNQCAHVWIDGKKQKMCCSQSRNGEWCSNQQVDGKCGNDDGYCQPSLECGAAGTCEPRPPVNCKGAWSACEGACNDRVKTYRVTTEREFGGKPCPHSEGDTAKCKSNCKSVQEACGRASECVSNDCWHGVCVPARNKYSGISGTDGIVDKNGSGQSCYADDQCTSKKCADWNGAGHRRFCYQAPPPPPPPPPVSCQGTWSACWGDCDNRYQRYDVTRWSEHNGAQCPSSNGDVRSCASTCIADHHPCAADQDCRSKMCGLRRTDHGYYCNSSSEWKHHHWSVNMDDGHWCDEDFQCKGGKCDAGFCRSLDVQNEGANCWSDCNGKAGHCDEFCGKDAKCCRFLHWDSKENGCAEKGGNGIHACTRQ